jgi:hypothetical protein
VARYRERAKASGAQAAKADREAWASFAHVLLTANDFFYID